LAFGLQSYVYMRGKLLLTCLVWLTAVSTASPQAVAPPDTAAADESPVVNQPEAARRIVEQANTFRRSEKLAEFRPSEALQKAAENFAQFMARTGKYGHTADDQQPRDRAAKQGYEACIVAENIGLQFSSERLTPVALATAFVEGWKNSKNHRANLLDPALTELGVAVAQSEKTGKYYAVQLFGRPRSESIRVEIENRADVLVKYKLGEQTFELDKQTVRIHELCRPDKFTFELPTADDAERTVVEPVKAKAKLVIERIDGQLTVERASEP
jgi:uncharacterized protein YkwD